MREQARYKDIYIRWDNVRCCFSYTIRVAKLGGGWEIERWGAPTVEAAKRDIDRIIERNAKMVEIMKEHPHD